MYWLFIIYIYVYNLNVLRMYVKKFEALNNLNKNETYAFKSGEINVLFIGGCRSFVYSLFFEELCNCNLYLKNAQYGIGAIAVHIMESCKINKNQNLINTIENADIIICEQIRHYDMLNTSNECEQSMFNNFNIKPTCKIINVPNLECGYEPTPESKKQNISRLVNHCKKYNFEKLSNYIDENATTIDSMFITINHPSNSLCCQLMKELIETHFGVIIDSRLMSVMQRIRIFDS